MSKSIITKFINNANAEKSPETVNEEFAHIMKREAVKAVAFKIGGAVATIAALVLIEKHLKNSETEDQNI